MSEARGRYSGEIQSLIDALAPSAISPGWFKYAEKEGKGAMKPRTLKLHADLWQRLQKIQKNLSFNKNTMVAATKAIMENHLDEWNLSDTQSLEQPKVLSNRLRLACRHIGQGLVKKPSPAWIGAIFATKVLDDKKHPAKKAMKEKEQSENEEQENEDEQEEEEEEEEEKEEEKEEEQEEEQEEEEEEEVEEEEVVTVEEEHEKTGKKKPGKKKPGNIANAKLGKAKLGKAKPEKVKPDTAKPGNTVTGSSAAAKENAVEWAFFGWDQELETAWRSPSQPGGVRRRVCEYSTDIRHPKDPQPHKFMLAMFGEDVYELSDMSVAAWDLRIAAQVNKPKHAVAPAALWETEHRSSGLSVTIRRRTDRQPLISLYHDRSQICQVPEKAFDDIPSAVSFLKIIGEKFALDEVSRSMIPKLRNDMARARGITLKEYVMKRPSAAAVTGSSEAACSSGAAAVTGSSEAAAGSAPAGASGSSNTASSSRKRKQIGSPSTEPKCAGTKQRVVDGKVVHKKPAAAKRRAQAEPRGKRQVDVVDVVDDDEHQVDEDDEDDEDEESDVFIPDPPEYSWLDDMMKLTD
jgi:hypothetical protein